jgi:GTP-binding protein
MNSAHKLFAGECRFLLSVAQLEQLPPVTHAEIAFIGRSNVGKSSLINALTSRKGLARASNTPGRTQMLNFFLLSDALMLVDLPGYGYAKAPREVVAEWNRLIRDYLRGRASLRRVCVLIDSRHGIKDSDREMMRMLDDCAVSYQLILTKSDKVGPTAVTQMREQTLELSKKFPACHPELFVTSAEKGTGLDEVRNALAQFAGNV